MAASAVGVVDLGDARDGHVSFLFFLRGYGNWYPYEKYSRSFHHPMSRRKLQKFAAFIAYDNCYTPHEDGKKPITTWNTKGRPVILELACGTGAYTVELARRFPEYFVIGMDIKGSRMWTGAKEALDEKLDNAMFIRTHIENLADILEPASVDEIWITFADPFLAKGKEKKRLTSPRFLGLYTRVLKPGGIVHLKTDSVELFEYSLETIPTFEQEKKLQFVLEEVIQNVYKDPAPEILTSIQTTYEKRHLAEGRVIRYLRAKLV